MGAHINKTLLAVSGALGLFSAMSEQYLTLIILVVVVIVLDVISGLIRSVATGVPITSAKGTKGFWKKMVLLFSMAFAFFLDIAFPLLLDPWKRGATSTAAISASFST